MLIWPSRAYLYHKSGGAKTFFRIVFSLCNHAVDKAFHDLDATKKNDTMQCLVEQRNERLKEHVLCFRRSMLSPTWYGRAGCSARFAFIKEFLREACLGHHVLLSGRKVEIQEKFIIQYNVYVTSSKHDRTA